MPHVPPPVIALAAAGVQHAVAPSSRTGPARRLLAGAVAMGSVALAGATIRRFGAAGTTVDPTDPARASTLVTDGPNAVTRNPMYVGLAGLLAAHAFARGGLRTWLPVAGFVAAVDRLQIQPEEAALKATFGDGYDAYRARVRRWL
ncbi:methyltransferase family protein [Knoellia sp. LjRoot47]|uniref:methyltransferase family protein n=1 Tax=Knoellia sp. LjRoot47 TaxID=3342330 RepID=UPI003ECF6B52